jgi:Ca2+-binding EF-hand superfamily protein
MTAEEVVKNLAGLLNQISNSEQQVELHRQNLVYHREFNANQLFEILKSPTTKKITINNLHNFIKKANKIQILPREVELLFNSLDKQRDGLLCWQEFKSAFLPKECYFPENPNFVNKKNYGKNQVSKEIVDLVVGVLKAELEVLKILEGMKRRLCNSRFFNMRRTFELIDIDKKGWLDIRDIFDFMKSEIQGVGYANGERVLRRMDVTEDKKISYFEWERGISPIVKDFRRNEKFGNSREKADYPSIGERVNYGKNKFEYNPPSVGYVEDLSRVSRRSFLTECRSPGPKNRAENRAELREVLKQFKKKRSKSPKKRRSKSRRRSISSRKSSKSYGHRSRSKRSRRSRSKSKSKSAHRRHKSRRKSKSKRYKRERVNEMRNSVLTQPLMNFDTISENYRTNTFRNIEHKPLVVPDPIPAHKILQENNRLLSHSVLEDITNGLGLSKDELKSAIYARTPTKLARRANAIRAHSRTASRSKSCSRSISKRYSTSPKPNGKTSRAGLDLSPQQLRDSLKINLVSARRTVEKNNKFVPTERKLNFRLPYKNDENRPERYSTNLARTYSKNRTGEYKYGRNGNKASPLNHPTRYTTLTEPYKTQHHPRVNDYYQELASPQKKGIDEYRKKTSKQKIENSFKKGSTNVANIEVSELIMASPLPPASKRSSSIDSTNTQTSKKTLKADSYNNSPNKKKPLDKKSEEQLKNSLGFLIKNFRLIESKKYALNQIGKFCPRKLFKKIDLSKRNYVTIEHLKHLLRLLKWKFYEEDVAKVINRHDNDKDGKLNFEEFYKMITPHDTLYSEDFQRENFKGNFGVELVDLEDPELAMAIQELMQVLMVTEKNDDTIRDIIAPILEKKFEEISVNGNRLSFDVIDEMFMGYGVYTKRRELKAIVTRFDLSFEGKFKILENVKENCFGEIKDIGEARRVGEKLVGVGYGGRREYGQPLR